MLEHAGIGFRITPALHRRAGVAVYAAFKTASLKPADSGMLAVSDNTQAFVPGRGNKVVSKQIESLFA
ncbi:hypothetical protein Q5A_007655 [Serratia inhibens PRI-2C]|nr:hypothetical protein Q5A_007655 [Serratia inhibens PRI-2C]